MTQQRDKGSKCVDRNGATSCYATAVSSTTALVAALRISAVGGMVLGSGSVQDELKRQSTPYAAPETNAEPMYSNINVVSSQFSAEGKKARNL